MEASVFKDRRYPWIWHHRIQGSSRARNLYSQAARLKKLVQTSFKASARWWFFRPGATVMAMPSAAQLHKPFCGAEDRRLSSGL